MKYFLAITLVAVAFIATRAPAPAGVDISAEERELCKQQGCTVWTENELQTLVENIYKRGYEAGRKSL